MAQRKLVTIEILPIAKQDLKEIADFISKGSIRYAKLEKQLILDAISKLYYTPNLGRPFDYKSIDARKMVFRNYLIIYRFKTASIIEILTVHHHARLLGNNPAFKDDDDSARLRIKHPRSPHSLPFACNKLSMFL